MKILLIALMFFASLNLHASDLQSQEEVRAVMNEILEKEFTGAVETREEYAKYSYQPGFYWEVVPEAEMDTYGAGENIVLSYKIQDISVSFDKAKAIVVFKKIARTLLYEKGIEEKQEDLRVVYNLSKINGKWWVIDPPDFNISLDAIISFYTAKMNGLEKEYGKESAHSGKTYKLLNALKSLEKKYSNGIK